LQVSFRADTSCRFCGGRRYESSFWLSAPRRRGRAEHTIQAEDDEDRVTGSWRLTTCDSVQFERRAVDWEDEDVEANPFRDGEGVAGPEEDDDDRPYFRRARARAVTLEIGLVSVVLARRQVGVADGRETGSSLQLLGYKHGSPTAGEDGGQSRRRFVFEF
jgi:hypothetical protein